MEWTRRSFSASGFEGWRTFGELRRAELPRQLGVYLVFVESSSADPTFLQESVGGTHKGKPLTLPISDLQAAWVPGSDLLYIGKAAAGLGIFERLWAYARQGRGRSAGHRGGRRLWQLRESENLVVAWRETGALDPAEVEQCLLALYIDAHGARPFANMNGGRKHSPTQAREYLAGWIDDLEMRTGDQATS